MEQTQTIIQDIKSVEEKELEKKKDNVKTFFETFCQYVIDNKPEPVDKKKLLAISLINHVEIFLDNYQLKDTLTNAIRSMILEWATIHLDTSTNYNPVETTEVFEKLNHNKPHEHHKYHESHEHHKYHEPSELREHYKYHEPIEESLESTSSSIQSSSLSDEEPVKIKTNVKEKAKEKDLDEKRTECPCGGHWTDSKNKPIHESSAKHKKWVAQELKNKKEMEKPKSWSKPEQKKIELKPKSKPEKWIRSK